MIVGSMLCAALPHRSSLKIGLDGENGFFPTYRRPVTKTSCKVALTARLLRTV
jgi:hypothetical protein